MAKRFIETGFFRDPFVRSLQGAYKGLYIYLFLECSNSGIWDVELDVAKIRCGINDALTADEILTMFPEKIISLDNGQKWFLVNYVKVQHNGVLNEKNKAHTGAIFELKKFNLLKKISENEYEIFFKNNQKEEGASEGLTSPTGNGNGNSIGNGNKNKRAKKKFEPPTEKEVLDYFLDNGYKIEVAKKAFKYYNELNWKDSKGQQINSWKAKMIAVWFKDENKIQKTEESKSNTVAGRQNQETVASNYQNFLHSDGQ
ncbi:MAG: hypothetical protein KGZ59_00880 [Chitinophagaceae bacterium]|nr:hypothetical protein [Chitinophagaceae bacterium]